jgi:hypothetical protein
MKKLVFADGERAPDRIAMKASASSKAAKGQMTGMLGVYLVAAELTKRGFIVSPTSRSAFGADLLVTDERCSKAWSIQVKTNRKAASFWLLSRHAADLQSDSHVYVFVNLRGDERPDYFVALSADVARLHRVSKSSTGSVWWSIDAEKIRDRKDGWTAVFGEAS